MNTPPQPYLIVGAGPAGLSAASALCRGGCNARVLEQDQHVGGLARTETYRGYRFDIGGHRFFTKSELIAHMWEDLLGADLLTVRRTSRIYYQGRFLQYPLSLPNALHKLGPAESVHIVGSYLAAKLRKQPAEPTFESWVSKRFGRRLYEMFFKTYTEKVWGIPCDQIMADWAAQRIRGLSLGEALAHALLGNSKARSLTGTFRYPRQGPGMMWERLQKRIEQDGGKVELGSRVTRIHHDQGRITHVTWAHDHGSATVATGHLISTLPLGHLVPRLNPPPPATVRDAAAGLAYRSLILVGLILKKELPLKDQWIYIHSPDVRVGRVQVSRNWSAELVPAAGNESLGMEYFCDEDDTLWRMDDDALLDLAGKELHRLGLAAPDDVEDGIVIRQPKAYPVYTPGYQQRLQVIRDYLAGLDNLQIAGRNGMHRYNNMDHSMLSGLQAAENVMGGDHDPWGVNADSEYHEETKNAEKVPALEPG